MEIVTFIAFESQTIEVFGRCCLSMFLGVIFFFFFAGEGLVLEEISFLILLPLV